MKGNSRGYIAITSALLIAFLVTIIAAVLSLTVYLSRFNALGAEAKERSLVLAEACADAALLKLAQNLSYAGNETITIAPPDTCRVLSLQTQGSQKVITTTATIQGATTNIKVTANTSPRVTIASWEEIP